MEQQYSIETREKEITATRILNAHRELVWKVWTESEHIKHWWGPKGFTNTIEIMDVRPGGQWNFFMHGPDGIDYRNEITYLEVQKPSVIVYKHGPSPKFIVTVTFEENDEKTKLTMNMSFETAEERERTVKKFNAVEGLKQTLERLKNYIYNEQF